VGQKNVFSWATARQRSWQLQSEERAVKAEAAEGREVPPQWRTSNSDMSRPAASLPSARVRRLAPLPRQQLDGQHADSLRDQREAEEYFIRKGVRSLWASLTEKIYCDRPDDLEAYLAREFASLAEEKGGEDGLHRKELLMGKDARLLRVRVDASTSAGMQHKEISRIVPTSGTAARRILASVKASACLMVDELWSPSGAGRPAQGLTSTDGNIPLSDTQKKHVLNPAVLEAENALLAFWMMRGGGESGDKAIAAWFCRTAACLEWEQAGTTRPPRGQELVNSKLATALTLGSRWTAIGAAKPAKSRVLESEQLAAALGSKTHFTVQELEAFNIKNLRAHDVIKSGGLFFRPSSTIEFTQQEWDAFGITEVSLSSFIQSAGTYFRPSAGRMQEQLVSGEASQSLDAGQLLSVLECELGTTMDMASSEELLGRIVGKGGAVLLSEKALNGWLRKRFPAFQVQQMLESLRLPPDLVDQLLGAGGDGLELERLWSLTEDDVRLALEASVDEWAQAIYKKIAAFKQALSGEQGDTANLKFAGDLGRHGSSFEGKFEKAAAFEDGLDKFIGQPDPRVLDAVINEHCNSANSDTRFTTSNYGLTCTPKEELEAALKPNPQKLYPGAGEGHDKREMVRFRVYLSAAGCLDDDKWQDEEWRDVLLKIRDECGSLELTEEDKVREAMVLIMQALQGFSTTITKVQRSLRAHAAKGRPVTMAMLFDVLGEEKGWSRAVTERFIARGRELLRLAGLRPEEVLCIRLYTGPMFMHYNAGLRKFPPDILETMKDNKYVTTLHCINSAITKLARASPLTTRCVFRGSNKMQLPLEFAARDSLGRMGIVETGFLSMTRLREMAMQYAARGSLSTVLRVTRGDRSSGAFIAAFSFYISEEEILFPPLSYMEVVVLVERAPCRASFAHAFADPLQSRILLSVRIHVTPLANLW